MGKINKIYIGADHAGFALKEKLKSYLERNGFDYEDLSPKLIEGDDYPDVAFLLGKKVVADKSGESKGVLVCGGGNGMSIAANKVSGVRAAEAFDVKTARLSRTDNDANIISLGSWDVSSWSAKRILKIWLNTNFSGEERHRRRLRKISDFERKG